MAKIEIGVVPFRFPTPEEARRAFRDVDSRVTEAELVVSGFSGILNGDTPFLILGGPNAGHLLEACRYAEQVGGVQIEDIGPESLLPFAERIATAHEQGFHGRVDHGEGTRL